MSRICLTPFIFTLLLSLGSVFAGPGDLDPPFGNAGRVLEPIGSSYDAASGLLVQPDGKIVTAGTSTVAGNDDFGVMRLLPDGGLDPGFGSGGKVTTALGSGVDNPFDIAIQGDGKLVVVGQSETGGNYSFGVARYNADGSLDSGFASGGKLIFNPGPGGGAATSVAVQSDQKLLVAGEGYNGGGSQSYAVVRLNTDGSPDTSFGTGGVVLDQVLAGAVSINDLAIQTDGKIVVVGDGYNGGSNALTVVARYLADGTRDASFGTGGTVQLAVAGKNTICNDIVVQPDGKLVVAGQVNFLDSASVFVVRLLANGTLDPGFATGGMSQVSISATYDVAEVVRLQADGKILVAGSTQQKSNYAVALLRYLPDGTLDAGFGNAGVVATRAGLADSGVECMAVLPDGRILLGGDAYNGRDFDVAVLRFQGGEPIPPLDAPVVDTKTMRTDGAAFLSFNAPAVDSGLVGGAATVQTSDRRKQTLIYGGANADALAQTGGQDPEGATFVTLGDPVFAGEAIGFSGVAVQTPASSPLARLGRDLGTARLFAVKPGGRLAALYSQLHRAAGVHRLAAQADPAPQVTGGQFAKFKGFAVPRGRVGMLYAALLHRGGTVTPVNDFGIWRERSDGSGTDLLLQTGNRFSRARGTTPDRGLTKVTFLPPVTNSTDQRRTVAPDGGLAVMAKFDDGSSGVVRVAADGSVDIAVDTAASVPDESGTGDANIVFEEFSPPATASGGKIALVAALKAAQRGLPAPPKQAIFANLGGNLSRVMQRGEPAPGRRGVSFGQLGQPALGAKGMIGLMATLSGRGVTPPTRTAIVRLDQGKKTVVARLGDPVPGMPDGAVYRKFMSMVVTDSDPARVVYTATVGGGGVNGASNTGLWCASATGTNLLVRKGGTIKVGGQPLAVRTLDALQAPKNNPGQGRSTDEAGFVTAKVKLSDGRQGVLRIPLP